MPYILNEVFNIETEYEEEFGKVSPQILAAAELVWRKSGAFYSNLIYDQHQCLRILMRAIAIVSAKFNNNQNHIQNLTSYLHITFRHLILAEISKGKRHFELEKANAAKRNETEFENVEENIQQKILISQLRSRMNDWMRAVFDMQALGYQYKDLVPKYGLSENVIRSKYSKNLLRLKHQIQGEMDDIEKGLKTGK